MSAPPESEPAAASTQDIELQSVLARPADQRRREFKYRCAQSVVFGLPVLALQAWGRSLGGSAQESDRWVALLQALLAGWVTYVAATGMLVEGMMSLAARGRAWFGADAVVATAAVLAYLWSAVSALGILVYGYPFYRPLLFHWVVIVLAVWCAGRWLWLSRMIDSKMPPRL